MTPFPETLPGTEPNDTDDTESVRLRPSRSQKKREARAVFDLGEVLVKLRPALIRRMPLEDEVREAVLIGQSLTKNARARQLRRIAKLLRAVDTQPLVDALRDGGHLP